eukprot:scaffold51128_cov78-Cyclotella_meneghiniana.AAC.2
MAWVDWTRRWVSVVRARSAAWSWILIWASDFSSFSFRCWMRAYLLYLENSPGSNGNSPPKTVDDFLIKSRQKTKEEKGKRELQQP